MPRHGCGTAPGQERRAGNEVAADGVISTMSLLLAAAGDVCDDLTSMLLLLLLLMMMTMVRAMAVI